MAAGDVRDFKVYHEEFFGGMTEVLQQNANVFNSAARNTLMLVPRRLKGHYEKESFFKSLSGLVSRRDINSTGAAADSKLEQGENVGVKVNRKIGPVANTLDSFRKIGEDPRVMSYQLGKQTAAAVAVDYLNTVLRGAAAALANVSGVLHNATDGTIATSDIVTGLSKFGDAAGSIVAIVMHSKPYFDLMQEQITANILEVSGFVIKEGSPLTLGRPVIVTDSPALYEANGVSSGIHKYTTLGLVAGAGEAAQSEEEQIISEIVTGLENLVMRVQGEYAFNAKIKGFTWDVTNGGVNPTDAALATGSNWDQTAADVKSLAGVAITSR